MIKFIAEVSGNHQQNLSTALELTRIAKDAGADIVKYQSYRPESLTIDCNNDYFIVKDKESPWYGRTLWDIYQESNTPREWFPILFNECKKINLQYLVTPYSEDDLNFLESLDCPMYKISAFEARDFDFVKKVIDTKKQIFLSVGLLTLDEINALWYFLKAKNNQSFIMHSISKYPPKFSDCNFPRFAKLKQITNNLGFSDHSLDELTTLTAITLGATVIEKHIKKYDDSIDAHFSLNQWEFEKLIKTCKEHYSNIFKEIKEESDYARSIFCIRDIRKGDAFTSENVKVIRPGSGLHPGHYLTLLNQSAKRDILRGHPILPSDL
jgi:pseudaminic acid synthase